VERYSFKLLLILIGVLFLNIPSVYAQTAEEYLSVGNDNFKLRNFDKAIAGYTKALDINPNLAKAYNNRGVAYAEEGSLSRAIADFTMAIANNLKDAEAYNNRGHAYADQGNLSQAIFDYTKAIKINTFYVKAYNNREIAYYKLKEYDKAWADVRKVEEIGGSINPRFIENLKQASGKN
jgi:tetratricopeptide (TPR) repeat protein